MVEALKVFVPAIAPYMIEALTVFEPVRAP
jgi:hypothetical protein